jgi:hypothetical protein
MPLLALTPRLGLFSDEALRILLDEAAVAVLLRV